MWTLYILVLAGAAAQLVLGECPLNCKPGLKCNDPVGWCPECEPAYYGSRCEKRTECVFDPNGVGYRGKKSTTRTGVGCQAWASQSPHKSFYVDEEENYCRNPDNTNGGPWCYTLDPNKRWDFCGVPECGVCPLHCHPGLECSIRDSSCPECMPAYQGPRCEERTECVFDRNGVGYRGKKSTTRTGVGCQAWASHSPHKSNFVDEEKNYCRNPDNTDGGPWCYTLDPNKRWDFCGVPECDNDDENRSRKVFWGVVLALLFGQFLLLS